MTLPVEGPSAWPAIEAAFRGALAVPHYTDLLAAAGVDPASIDTPARFRDRVPVLRKGDLYRPDVPFHRLCRGGTLGQPAAVMTSSGFTGNNAFGILTSTEAANTQAAVDAGLALLFQADQIPTLLINAFGMGIAVPTRHTFAATGPRPDLVLRILETFGGYFEQVLILGDPHLLKAVVDQGNARQLDWERRGVSLFSGQDWLPETLRTYLCLETGMDPERPEGRRKYLQTMGLTELGLLLFLETPASVRLRRAAMANAALRQLLFGSDWPVVPSLFHFDPQRFHLEATGPANDDLVVTTLSLDIAAPLIRYAPGDQGQPIDGAALARGLTDLGLVDLMPQLPLPLAWTSGRLGTVPAERPALRIDALRHHLFRDIPTARHLTGHFTRVDAAGATKLSVQLRAGVAPSGRLSAALRAALFADAAEAVPVQLVPYHDYQPGLALDFERKFSHLGT